MSALRAGSIGAALLLWLACAGTRSTPPAAARAFDFERDTFAFVNEVYWIHDLLEDGRPASRRRAADVETGQRCVAMARIARQFFRSARFAPERPKLSEVEYRDRVRQVIDGDPRDEAAPGPAVVIPGYAGLRDFSAAEEALLKQQLGGRWRSYVQRGNWRMVFPFAPRQQRATANELAADVARGHPPIVRLVTFPHITVNHTVLVYEAESTPTQIRFTTYDPNDKDAPALLVFDRATATFRLEGTEYAPSRVVDAYEIYDGFFF